MNDVADLLELAVSYEGWIVKATELLNKAGLGDKVDLFASRLRSTGKAYFAFDEVVLVLREVIWPADGGAIVTELDSSTETLWRAEREENGR